MTAEPLAALSAIGTVQRDMAARQGAAVRVAVQQHPWAETLSGEIKSEHRTLKTTLRDGPVEAATVSRARLDALVAELENAGRRRK